MSTREILSKRLLDMARAQGVTISTAESCTGGWIGKSLTDPAGSSAVFAGSAVTYSNSAKMRMLSVTKSAFHEGAVSEDVALAMADGVRKLLNTNMAIAVTGVAGPGGGSASKPVGTVWFSLSRAEHPTLAVKQNFGDQGRDRVRELTVLYALEWMIQSLSAV